MVVWRYKRPDEHREGVIQSAVESFKGKVTWDIYLGGRNWVLLPRKVREFIKRNKIRVDVEALRQLAEQDPAFGKSANKELPELADVISKALSLRTK